MKLLIATGLSAAVAAVAAAGVASGQAAPQTLKLNLNHERFGFVDVAPKGGPSKPPSQGDEFVIAWPTRTPCPTAGRSTSARPSWCCSR